MQQKQIEHPLRKIEFAYDETKPWTEQDESLLKSYIDVHEYELERKKEGRQLMIEYSERDKEVEKAREELLKVKEIFAATRLLADHLLSDIALKKSHAVEKFYESVNATGLAIQEYDKIMRPIGEDKSLDERKAKYFDEQDDIKAWDAFSDMNCEHSQNYETNSIDIVSFDKEDEKFRTFLSVLNDHSNSTMDYMNNVIQNYNSLMAETELQYELYTEFMKRVQLIEKITGSNSGAAYFNMN